LRDAASTVHSQVLGPMQVCGWTKLSRGRGPTGCRHPEGSVVRRGAQFSWLPFGYWFSIDPRTFAGEAASVGHDNVELALRSALKKKARDLLASPGSGPMRIGICSDVSIAQGLRVKRHDHDERLHDHRDNHPVVGLRRTGSRRRGQPLRDHHHPDRQLQVWQPRCHERPTAAPSPPLCGAQARHGAPNDFNRARSFLLKFTMMYDS
jgi:hypothetical protein